MGATPPATLPRVAREDPDAARRVCGGFLGLGRDVGDTRGVDATTVVALAGIGGTLLAPLLTGWVRHRHARAERLLDARIEVYADLMDVAATTADNAQTWSAMPLADLTEPDNTHLNRVFIQIDRLLAIVAGASGRPPGGVRSIPVSMPTREPDCLLWFQGMRSDDRRARLDRPMQRSG